MSGTLTASQVKPGVRRSKKYTTGRVCAFETCETVISVYNKKKFCFLHAPISYPRVRGHLPREKNQFNNFYERKYTKWVKL